MEFKEQEECAVDAVGGVGVGGEGSGEDRGEYGGGGGGGGDEGGGHSHVVKDKKLHTGGVLFNRLTQDNAETQNRHDCEGKLPAFVLKNVLSRSECEQLIEGIRDEPELQYEFWNPEEPHKTDLRNVETVEVHDQKLADLLWERMKDHVVKTQHVPEDDDRWECGVAGEWTAVGINPVLLFANYGPGNHFSPHTDGNNVVDFNTRSLFSVLVYLDDCDDGGGTLIFKEKHDFVKDDKGRLRYPPEAMTDKALCRVGEVLVFSQELLHEGEPVGDDSRKVIIRTDVMYERSPAICDSEDDKEAFRLYQQATLLEGQKKYKEANITYKKSCRLSEQLARQLNIYGAF